MSEDSGASMVRFLDGRDLSAESLHQGATACAGALQRAQEEVGDRVVVMLDNCQKFLFSFFGCSMTAAAAMVPLNTGLIGMSLRYQLEDADASLAIVDARYLPRLEEASVDCALRRVVVGALRNVVEPHVEAYDDFVAPGRDEGTFVPVPQKRRDRSMILYTPGTTGPPKGIVYSHGATLAFADMGARGYAYVAGDVAFTCLPLFHVNALLNVTLGAILHSVPVVLSARFSVSSFWEQVVEAGATATPLLGSMATLLLQREPSAPERAQRLRTACVVPAPIEYHDQLEERFGFHVITFYGLTDAGTLTTTDVTRLGSCGKAFPEWELIIVDDDDQGLGPGEVGEMLVRSKVPHIRPLGYWKKPEATVETWQNQWIHTGDYLRCDDEGYFYFVDRKKDAIRSRGENMSSFEVEQIALGHPAVADAAVYAVDPDPSEDDVMLAVVSSEKHPLDWAELQRYCAERLPYFAVPRYFRECESLPRTENGKVQKGGRRARASPRVRPTLGSCAAPRRHRTKKGRAPQS